MENDMKNKTRGYYQPPMNRPLNRNLLHETPWGREAWRLQSEENQSRNDADEPGGGSTHGVCRMTPGAERHAYHLRLLIGRALAPLTLERLPPPVTSVSENCAVCWNRLSRTYRHGNHHRRGPGIHHNDYCHHHHCNEPCRPNEDQCAA